MYKKPPSKPKAEKQSTPELSTDDDDNYDDPNETSVYNEAEIGPATTNAPEPPKVATNSGISLSPHMCFRNSQGTTICEVYTEHSRVVTFDVGLKPSVSVEENNTDEICRYPLGKKFLRSGDLIVNKAHQALIESDSYHHKVVNFLLFFQSV